MSARTYACILRLIFIFCMKNEIFQIFKISTFQICFVIFHEKSNYWRDFSSKSNQIDVNCMFWSFRTCSKIAHDTYTCIFDRFFDHHVPSSMNGKTLDTLLQNHRINCVYDDNYPQNSANKEPIAAAIRKALTVSTCVGTSALPGRDHGHAGKRVQHLRLPSYIHIILKSFCFLLLLLYN